MDTWYKVSPHTTEPAPVEAENVTEKMITIDGRRYRKRGSYESFFPSRAEAWDRIEQLARNRIEAAEAKLKHARLAIERSTEDLKRIRRARDC